MQVTEILTDHTLMALDLQGAEDYPIRFYLDIMDQFDRAGIHWHWHPALEFNVITKGTMEYFVENEHYTLTAGQGIVKNAHLLHMAQPASHTPDAAMFSVIMDPAFLAPAGSVIYRKYIAPLLGSQGLGSLVLRPEVPWQRAMLEGLRQAYALSQAETGAYELAIHTHMCQVWIAMAEHQEELPRRGLSPAPEVLAQVEGVAARYGLKAPRRVVVLPGLESAFVCGPLRPVLALPDRPVDDKVLLHELLHLRHGDVWAGVGVCALRCLHWCNPLIWYCCDRMQNDCEALCDQRVLERLGYLMGRYVYLCDALDDLEDDREKGNYNPFLADQSAGPEQIENAIGTLYLTIAEAAKTFELLELKRFEPILANILYQGMKETVDSIVSKKEKTI